MENELYKYSTENNFKSNQNNLNDKSKISQNKNTASNSENTKKLSQLTLLLGITPMPDTNWNAIQLNRNIAIGS